ncbi:thiopurine S-methyltransferase [Oceanimonas doudoroffii]|uniref:Thiopurine S-methyltransferase n=1 Tax=Oceanimonas doudoroffii TaxID=84158 RepID=A0A233RHP6_9GAMM|nr:thiopurine S-methyltransferase [Oceanimonas doudoroffii]OXY82913.1 thiopurine S-methyltransferase [Oceanimonas doudoroffii]
MDANFWHQRWQSSRIGFHQSDINLHLRTCWHHTGAGPGTEVLVPLCGKSLDMHWLAEQGHTVAGFELSPLAVAGFFEEAGLTPERTAEGAFEHWLCAPYHLYAGDFFAAEQLGRQFNAAYDRAALIALPPAMRADYVDLMARLITSGGRVLLVTLNHDSAKDQTPPFAVDETEVRTLFESRFEVSLLDRQQQGRQHPRVAAGDCTFFDELCFLLTRR